MATEYFIRTLNIEKYSALQQRFKSDKIFQPNGGGISVFAEGCARDSSDQNLCNHINTFYNKTVRVPPIFWKVSVDELLHFDGFKKVNLKQTPSDSQYSKTGKPDYCHYDIENVSEEEAEAFALAFCKPPYLYICEGGEEVQIPPNKFPKLRDWLREKKLYK